MDRWSNPFSLSSISATVGDQNTGLDGPVV